MPKINWKSVGAGALIVLLTLLAYWPALRAAFIWDDDAYVTHNPTLQDPGGLNRIWFEVAATPQYYPLVHTSYWLEYRLWGLNPPGYHLVNVLLHGLAAVLLWRVLERLQVRAAWFGAALFALHPVCVESVAWITERKNVLSAVFYFAAALAYLRFAFDSPQSQGGARDEGRVTRGRKSSQPANHSGSLAKSQLPTSNLQRSTFNIQPSAPPTLDTRHSTLFYFVSLLLFACALLSKTVAGSLPAALLLARWWKQGRLRWADVLPTLPFFGLGLGLGLHTAWLEKHHVGAQGAEWSLTLLERCLVAGRAVWFYAGKLFWPANLTFIYPRWEVSSSVWWQWLFPAAALVVVLALWRFRHRLGQGPLVAVLFFGGTLLPALGFVNIYPMRYSFVADHFQYLAGVGLLALVAAGVGKLPRRAQVALLVLPLALGVLTWRQTQIYRDLETLWHDTLAKNPACWLARNNLGAAYVEQGRFAEAMDQLQKSLQSNAAIPETYVNLASAFLKMKRPSEAITNYEISLRMQPASLEARVGLGEALIQLGQLDAAAAQFQEALRSHPERPEVHTALGRVLAMQGKVQEAIEHDREALRLAPYSAETHNNLGLALVSLGKWPDAGAEYEAALHDDPNFLEAHNNLGNVLLQTGNREEAMRHFEFFLKRQPRHAGAQENLGIALAMGGDMDGAVVHLREALRLEPANADARFNLANVLALQHKLDEAIAQYREVLRLAPKHVQAHNNLGCALADAGRQTEAVEHLKEALRLDPAFAPARDKLRSLGVDAPP